MHQNSTHRMMANSAILVTAAVDRLRKSNFMWIAALMGELGCVLKHEDGTVARSIPLPGRRKMSAQNLAFLNLRVSI